MAIRSIAQLKAWFKWGMYPTAAQFADWMDSYRHKEERIDIASVDQLPEQLNGKYPDSDGKLLERKTTELERSLTTHEQYSEEKFGTIYDRLDELDETKIDKTAIGQADGVAGLDSQGRVPASQLPSYVDDVLEGTLRSVTTFVDPEGTPYGPESGKIYIDTTTNKEYRWSGSQYAVISESLALGETSSTAYRGDRGKAAYDHAQIKDGSNPHRTTFASLPDKPTALPADGGNADTVGGLGKERFARVNEAAYTNDLNTINGLGGFIGNPGDNFASPERHYPIQEAGILIYGKSAYDSANQIYGSYKSNRWFCRGSGTGPTQKTDWAEFWTTKNLGQDDIFTRRGAATDLDAATTYGIYTYNRDTANAPTEFGSVFVLEGAGRAVNWTQLAIGYSVNLSNPCLYIRFRSDFIHWGDWIKVADATDSFIKRTMVEYDISNLPVDSGSYEVNDIPAYRGSLFIFNAPPKASRSGLGFYLSGGAISRPQLLTGLDNNPAKWTNLGEISVKTDLEKYLPLSGGRTLTGDVLIRNGKSLKSESDSGVVVGLTDTMGDGVHRTTLGSTRRPAVIVTDGTPVKRQDGSGAYAIWDTSNFDPDDYLPLSGGVTHKTTGDIYLGPNPASPTGQSFSLCDPAGNGVAGSDSRGSVLAAGIGVTRIRSGNTDLIHRKGGIEHIIWDASNFAPDDYMAIDRSHSGAGSSKIWVGTQAQYDAIATKSAETLYFIQE